MSRSSTRFQHLIPASSAPRLAAPLAAYHYLVHRLLSLLEFIYRTVSIQGIDVLPRPHASLQIASEQRLF